MAGRFITFEGGEGAGKSTQIARLGARLEARGLPVVVTREPGGSPRAERIREAVLGGGAKPFGPLAEAILFSAARLDHLDATIRPALARGAFVLCDRFLDSTRAYQGLDDRIEGNILRALERVVVAGTRPDLTIVLDVPPKLGLERAAARRTEQGEGADRFEAEDLAFHERLREAFRTIAASEPARCVLIDAARPPDKVEAEIWHVVKDRFGSDLAAATARRRAHG